MSKFFPLLFILLWSSAFITTLPIVQNSDPFSALAFRFFLVAVCFFIYSVYQRAKITINPKNLYFNSCSVLKEFEGGIVYLTEGGEKFYIIKD